MYSFLEFIASFFVVFTAIVVAPSVVWFVEDVIKGVREFHESQKLKNLK